MADIDKLFESINSEILDESTKLSMSVLFEQAINDAVKLKESELEVKNKAEITTFKETLTNKIDDYIQYFAEEFTKSNTKVIEDSVKLKLAEKVLKTFNGIVNDFNIQLDEKKINVEESLKESKTKIDTLTKQLIESRKETKLREKAALIVEAASTLTTDLQKSKLTDYAKKLTFDELFEKKIKSYVGTVLTEAKTKAKPIAEKLEVMPDDVTFLEEKVTTQMDKYLSRI